MGAVPAPPPDDVRARMDRMYRPQVLIYDLTRKPYLLGRDRLIEGLGARPGETVLEIGCGTGRNLVAIGRRSPGVGLLGVDAASPMLAAAGRGWGGPGSGAAPASPAAWPSGWTWTACSAGRGPSTTS